MKPLPARILVAPAVHVLEDGTALPTVSLRTGWRAQLIPPDQLREIADAMTAAADRLEETER
ncbi:hypothetical protein [Brachybacterium huguangmaarense]